MSKTISALGLIVGGAAIVAVGALVPGAQILEGVGVSIALAGVGIALRPNNAPVGAPSKETFTQGVSPRRAIYGQFQTAGVLTYASFTPSQNVSVDNQYLHLVYTICAHEISSFDGVVVDGSMYNFGTDLYYDPPGSSDTLWHLYPLDSGTPNDFYWQHMFFEFDFGRTNNTTQPFPSLAGSDSAWTGACLQRGCAKVHVILRADQNWPALFPSGQIPNIQFLVTGKKLIDPRVVTAWQASTGYVHYSYIVDNLGFVWIQTNASGTSGATRPNFEGVSGFPATVADNTCSWNCNGYENLQAGISLGTDSNPQGHLVKGRLVNDAWSPASSYSLGYILEAPTGYLQVSTTSSGVTGATEPNFALTVGGTTSDNTQGWACLGRSWHAINPSNSALVVNDYLQNSDFGMSAPLSTIDLSSVIAAANVCEEQELIIWNSDSTVVYENQYSCNGMFDYTSNRGDVLSSLLASMAGWAIPPGDLWHVFAGGYQTPTVALGDIDMRGAIKGDFRLSRRDVANSAKGKFTPAFLPPNPAAVVSLTLLPGVWQEQSFPAYQLNGLNGKPDYLNTEDGGQIIWLDLQLDFTTSLWTAQRLAKIALMRLRFQQSLTLPCKLSAFQLEAGDNFYFTHARWGITDGVYEVTQWALVSDAQSMDDKDASPALGIDMVVRQTDPSIWEFQGPTSSSNFGEYSPYGITGVMTGVE